MKFPKIQDLRKSLCNTIQEEDGCNDLNCSDCTLSMGNGVKLTLTATCPPAKVTILKPGEET